MGEYTPYSSLRLRVRAAREPERVYYYSDGRELRYSFSSGVVDVVLDTPAMYEIVVLEGAA